MEEEIILEEENFAIYGDMYKSTYDTNNNGIVDNAEQVNGHTVETDVPSNAVFTDTIYDDTEIKADITNLENTKADISDIPTKTSDLTNDDGFITKDVNDLTNYELKTNTGSTIELSINSSTYVMTLNLKNSAGTIISTGTIDLPLETMVVGASYDSTTKEIVLTLKNGQTTSFSVADLVSGLQSEITPSNKLSSDLVDDTNATNKFVTSTEKTTWNNKVGTTDYASDTKGGVIKTNAYGLAVSNGVLIPQKYTLGQYAGLTDYHIIAKGTLDNVLSQYSKTVELTQAEYDALETKDSNTLYIIKEA